MLSLYIEFRYKVPLLAGITQHCLCLLFINDHEVRIGVLSQLVDLVLHGVEVAGEPVLGPGVVLEGSGDWPVLGHHGGLEGDGCADSKIVDPFHLGFGNWSSFT